MLKNGRGYQVLKSEATECSIAAYRNRGARGGYKSRATKCSRAGRAWPFWECPVKTHTMHFPLFDSDDQQASKALSQVNISEFGGVLNRAR